MSYYNLLVKEKEGRDRYYQQVIDLKTEIVKITELYSLYNVDFLDKLMKFTKDYEKSKSN